MGSWIAKLAGHQKDAAESLKNPHAIASYTLFFGCIAFVLLLWIVIAILTTVRIYKKYSRRSEDGDTKVTVYDIKIMKCAARIRQRKLNFKNSLFTKGQSDLSQTRP